jgi:hypothetical protein
VELAHPKELKAISAAAVKVDRIVTTLPLTCGERPEVILIGGDSHLKKEFQTPVKQRTRLIQYLSKLIINS